VLRRRQCYIKISPSDVANTESPTREVDRMSDGDGHEVA